MRNSFIALVLALSAVGVSALAAKAQTQATPETGLPAAGSTVSGTLSASLPESSTLSTVPSTPAPAPKIRTHADMVPTAIAIPSIGLNDPVQKMGVLTNGEMAVPSGSTDNVGWYAAGTLPGQQGSAVFDAHVFAAFRGLSKVAVGDEILVKSADGTVQRFRVETTQVFKLANLSANYLFSRADKKRITLITCAGQLTPDHSTYTHRLVVSAVLEQ